MVTLARDGQKPLRFRARQLCRTGTGPDADEACDEITLWTRPDGKLAVSVRVDAAQEAVIVPHLPAARDWLEALCAGAGTGPKTEPEAESVAELETGPQAQAGPAADALAKLALLEDRTRAALRRERLGRVAAEALAHWVDCMDGTERDGRDERA